MFRKFAFITLVFLYSLPSADLLASTPIKALTPEVQKPHIHKPTGAAQWWMDRHEKKIFELKERAGLFDMIWVGDSITQGWEHSGAEIWQEFYGSRNALNLGYGGDHTENVLWRLEHGEVDGISPKIAVVMIGTNNTGYRQSKMPDNAEDTARGISAVVNDIRSRLPKTQVLLLAIFPRGKNSDDPLRLRNNEINGLIAKLDNGENVHFLDIGEAFLDTDGQLSPDIMPDFLHLTEQGYRIWAESIEPSIKALLNE